MARSRVVNLANFEQFTAINVLMDPGVIPGPVVISQCAQITMNFILTNGKTGNVVLHGRYAGGFAGTSAQCQAILSALNTGAAWTAMAAFMPTTVFLGGVTIRDLNQANQPLIASSGGAQAGTSASTALPDEVAAVVTKRTSRTGRAFRGRAYVPGWASNAVATGAVIAPAVVTALGNWANTWAGALSAQGYTHVLGLPARAAYTGSTGAAHPARAATTQDVTSVVVRDNHWDTQRRRGLR